MFGVFGFYCLKIQRRSCDCAIKNVEYQDTFTLTFSPQKSYGQIFVKFTFLGTFLVMFSAHFHEPRAHLHVVRLYLVSQHFGRVDCQQSEGLSYVILAMYPCETFTFTV